MNASASALMPILFLILAGYGMKKSRFLVEEAWPGIEKLTYFVLFPALLIRSLSNQVLTGTPWLTMLAVAGGALIVASAVIVVWHRIRCAVPDRTFTSIFQGGVRFNAYISLALAQAYFGPSGLAQCALLVGFMVIMINLLCVSALVVWGSGPRRGNLYFVYALVTNPLIAGCAIGWFLSVSGIGIGGIAGGILDIISAAALPMGLLIVGAALKPGLVRGHILPIAVSSLIQFGLKPLTVFLLLTVSGLSGLAAGVIYLSFMTPTAPSAYILARQLGGDAETMASIITFQTMFAFFAIPVITQLIGIKEFG